MKASKLIGGAVGLVNVLAAVISVFIINSKAEIEDPPLPVRPLETMVVVPVLYACFFGVRASPGVAGGGG